MKSALYISILMLSCFSCNFTGTAREQFTQLEKVDTSFVPMTKVLRNDKNLYLENGIYYLSQTTFSGYIIDSNLSGSVQSIGSYYNGMQHGLTKTFYANGKPRDCRSYRNNIAYGRHFGYWENGNMKFDFTYLNDKREGVQKQWYESGRPYAFLTFKDDKEVGLQKAWRENGKLYINYEVKDGIRYGLQKTALCYTLRDGKIK